MVLELVIPESEGKKKTTKNMVFSILVDSEAKTLTQLHREIKKKYHVSISFQAVIKSVKYLVEQHVLIRKNKIYSINKDWIFETKTFFDELYTTHFKVKKPLKKAEFGKEITVYTITNLFELDYLWNELLTNWARKETKDKRNVWKGKHCWWLIPRLHEEDILHDLFVKQGIKTYNVLTENTVLDKLAVSYYRKKEEHIRINKKIKPNHDSNVSAFGEFIVKFEIPEEISKKLDVLYFKTKKISDIDLKKVVDIFKENAEIEVIVIKDELLSNKIKEEIISYF